MKVPKRVRIYLALALASVVVFLLRREAQWQGGVELHTLVEAVAALSALVVGLIAFVHYYSRKTGLYLLLGTAFVGTAILDAYHAVVTSSYLVGTLPSELPSLIPSSWLASRLFLSAFVFLSWIAWRMERGSTSRARMKERHIFVTAAAVTLGVSVLIATVSLPGAYFDVGPFHRAAELVPALFFLAALIGYLRKGGWKNDDVEHWLVLSLIAGFAGQALFMPLSERSFDAMFAAAHLHKILSYCLVLAGFLISMSRLFRGAEEGANLLTAIMRSVPDQLFVKDANSRFTRMNETAARNFGLEKPEDAEGKSDFDFVGGGTAEQAERSYTEEQEMMRTGQPMLNMERQLRWPGQQYPRWYLTSKSLIHDHNNKVTGIVGVGRDITDRKGAEEALKEGETRLRLMLYEATDGVISIDQAGSIDTFNRAAENMFGWQEEEVVGQNISTLMPEPDHSQHPDYIRQYLRTRVARVIGTTTEVMGKRKDGSTFPLTLSVSESQIGDRRIFTGILRDVTEAKKAEEALRESEDRSRALVEAIPDGLFRLDGDGRIVEHVPGESYGKNLEAEPMEGRDVSELVPAEAVGRIQAGVKAVLSGEEVAPIEFTRGKENPRHFEGRLAKSGDNEVIAIVRDITEQKRAEAALRESENRSRALVEAIPDGLFRLAADGTVIEFVAGEESISFLQPERFVGAKVMDFLPPGAGERVMRGIRAALTGEPAAGIEVTLGEGEDKRDYEARFTESGGEEVIAIVRDVTERKRAERALMEARDEAEQANRAKSDFLSNMSHELRTPLNSVLGFSQLMGSDKREPLTESQQLAVGQIGTAGRHLLTLINDILDLAQIETGHLSLSLEPVEIGPMLDEAISMVNPLAQAREISVEYRPGGLEETWVWADRTRLKQVLFNLLSNAVKYNRDKGSIALSLGIAGKGRMGIDVEDTGPGIPPQRMHLLFEPFERLGAERSGMEGTGIGLTISKRLIEQMGGSITARSEPGKGSTFSIEISIAGMASRSAAEIMENLRVDNEGGGVLDVEKRRVLYVEDNPANLFLVQAILDRRPDIELLEAPDALVGIEMARTQQPDLIILDINIPGIDGFEALEQLKNMEETSSIPAIALSADAMPRQIEKGLEAGFLKYLTKPIDVDSFLEAIDEVLGDEPA